MLVIGICSSALYSTLGPLSESTGLSYNDLNSGTGYMVVISPFDDFSDSLTFF